MPSPLRFLLSLLLLLLLLSSSSFSLAQTSQTPLPSATNTTATAAAADPASNPDFIPKDVQVVTPVPDAPSVSNSSLCIDPLDAMWRPVPCPVVRAAGNLEAAGAAPTTVIRSDPSFTLLFSCRADPAFCAKARNAFVFVGEQIKKVVRLPVGIRVLASVFSFCQDQGIACDRTDTSVARQIGNAAPSLLIPLRDPDGRVRFYPQPLVRQFRMFTHPAFADADITARFSSDGDPWFPENGVPIRRDQTDFRWVALHEVMHGLGVGVTAWRDWSAPNGDQRQAKLFTPYPVADLSRDLSRGFIFDGEFFETVFDAGLVDVGTQLPSYAPERSLRPRRLPRLSSMVTTRLNYFRGRRPVRFRSLEHFFQVLARSPRAGRRARKIRDLVQLAEHAVAFDPEDGQPPILLASGPSLVASNPTGVIGHLDQDVYVRSPDFLMCPTVVSGVTLEEHQRRVLVYNNPGKDLSQVPWDGSFVGPGIRRILAYIGYDVRVPSAAQLRPASEFYPNVAPAAAAAPSTVVPAPTAPTDPALQRQTIANAPQVDLAQPAVVEPTKAAPVNGEQQQPPQQQQPDAPARNALDRMAAPAVTDAEPNADAPPKGKVAADQAMTTTTTTPAPHSALVQAPPSADIIPDDVEAPKTTGPQPARAGKDDNAFPATKIDAPIQAPASHADDGIVGIIAPDSTALLGTGNFTPATQAPATTESGSDRDNDDDDDDPVKVIDL
jgi:hypothetical protein